MRYNSILLNKLRSNTLFLLTFLLCLFLNPFFGQNKGLKKEEDVIRSIERKLGDLHNPSSDILISDELLNSFSNEEKFAFCIAFPENYSQNCGIGPDVSADYSDEFPAEEKDENEKQALINKSNELDSLASLKKIEAPPSTPSPPSPTENQLYGFLNGTQLNVFINNDGLMMSDRQLMCLKTIRKYVMNSIKVDAELKGYLPLNYKSVIIELNAVEMIPWLVDFFKRKTKEKDGDILTIFFNLMVVNKFPPFMKSISYQWLFVWSDRRPNSIIFNSANSKLTIERAMGLYSSKQK